LSSTRVCPFEWRYASKEMKRVFSEYNRLNTMARVELVLLRGLVKAGLVPEDVTEGIEDIELTEEDMLQLREIEKRVKHETAALIELLSKKYGKLGTYIHLGATSNDIIDTTWSLLIREALGIVEAKIVELLKAIVRLADEHIDTVMVGRTHGQQALPITLGFKLMNHAYEISLCLERLLESHRRLFVLKMSGAVGTMAAWRDKGLTIEEYVAKELGLRPVEISTQIYSRGRFAELVCELAILGSVLDRLATEIRNLQRTEISELAEPYYKGQIGSSTMPHKINPINCERVSGLARFLRGLCQPSLENIVLWHERDLSNSSCERIILPHAFFTIDEMLNTMIKVVRGLRVFPERMVENLKKSRGRIMAEALVVKLIMKGVAREKAYSYVRNLVMKSIKEDRSFKDIVLEDEFISSILSTDEVLKCLEYENYLGEYRRICKRAREYVLSIISRVKTERL